MQANMPYSKEVTMPLITKAPSPTATWELCHKQTSPTSKNDNMVHDTAMTLLSLGKDTSFSKNSLDTKLPMPMR